jgi:DNA-binding NtrC family response regulator
MKHTTAQRQQNTILIHSADRDLTKSLSIVLQDQFTILTTETVTELSRQRENHTVSLIVVDLEKSIPELIEELQLWRQSASSVPIIVLYAFRVTKPNWEISIRTLTTQLLYKPVQIEQILEAISNSIPGWSIPIRRSMPKPNKHFRLAYGGR